MSSSLQGARLLVRSYGDTLEQQIVGRGSSLACRDEELWLRVQGWLRDGDAQETHCLGLDPLVVMEESLKSACSRIKMYSGTFTHCIAPVLSASQVHQLFGLLGYQLSPSCPEQLCLQPPRGSSASLDDLLHLSCAFFVARCECHLLLSALGKHVGDTQWELSVVRERLRGSSLQAALDNTRKTLEVSQPPTELNDGEEDLYLDEQVNGGQKEAVASDDESPGPSSKAAKSGASPLPVHKRTNGAAYASPPKEPDSTRGSSASKRQDTPPPREWPDRGEQPQVTAAGKAEPKDGPFCSCPQSSNLLMRRCLDCDAPHDLNCASFYVCVAKGHRVSIADGPQEAGSPPPGSPSPEGVPDDQTAPASLRPISFHRCCDLTRPDPQVLCYTCRAFHSGSCREGRPCQLRHRSRELGVCSCGKLCSRKPLVLCRYCGNELCSNCWYRNPVTCSCGQTFDQSTSV
ncbi:unnamed protein product [Menidia menidia]|uniref:(Atlantic silverside) hypothetical protein n=1 Tax=Menidia menidia TaxID=238744 RepID=A0A8S4BME9_9TELE|nr:unnamed protein product [Menidia menidia]